MNEKIIQSKINGEVYIPSSKSHTIRALLIASFAHGESIIKNALDSADTRACIDACISMGAVINKNQNNITIKGTGGKVSIPKNIIDVKNSGTTLYLAIGIAALGSKEVRFTGDDQIKARSAENLLNSLKDLGVQVKSMNGFAPYSIKGPMLGGQTSIECPTSQYLSSLLLAAPMGNGDTVINVPLLHEKPYVEMTMAWLDGQNIVYKNDNFKRIEIKGKQKYTAFEKIIPGDFSSATFFFCAAAITGSEVVINGLDINDSQGDKAVIDYLTAMGCEIDIKGKSIIVKGKPMVGTVLDLNATPDALPAIAATACFAKGTTKIINVPQARMKETDRISVMKKELEKMGANIEELPDGLIIHGSVLKGTKVHGHSDHRVVMSLAIAGLGAQGITTVDTSEAVDITFPGFFSLLKKIKA